MFYALFIAILSAIPPDRERRPRVPRVPGADTVRGVDGEIIRETAAGISIDYDNRRRPPTFAFQVARGLGDGFHIRASLPDVSQVKKDDDDDREMRVQKEKVSGVFLPGNAFVLRKINPAFTLSFEVAPDVDGLLALSGRPTAMFSNLSLRENLQMESADQIVGGPHSEDVKIALELAPHLAALREARGERIQLRDRTAVSPSRALLYGLGHDMANLTDEAFAKFCEERKIPAIHVQINPETGFIEYTMSPRTDRTRRVPIATLGTQWVGMVNSRNALDHMINPYAYFRGERHFPYSRADLGSITDELNEFHAAQREGRVENVARVLYRKDRARRSRLAEELEGLPSDKFRQIALDALQRGIVERYSLELIQDELIYRIHNGTAHIRDVWDVLFTIPNPEGEFDELRQETIYALYTNDVYTEKLYAQIVSRNNMRSQTIRESVQEEDQQTFNAFITATIDDTNFISTSFRTNNEATTLRLAKANMISQIVGIPPEVDAELQRGAEPDAVVLTVVEKQDTFGNKARYSTTEEHELQRHYMNELTQLCNENGYEISLIEHSIVPQAYTPHSTSITVLIGDFVIADERRSLSQELSQASAAKTLLRKLKGTDITDMQIPQDMENQIQDLTVERNLELQTTLQHTTNTDGQPLSHYIYFLPGSLWFNIIGTGNTDEEARINAQKKLYVDLKKRSERNDRKDQ